MSQGKCLVDCGTFEVKDMVGINVDRHTHISPLYANVHTRLSFHFHLLQHEFAKAIEGKGGRFLEAPVSGSKVPAEQGQLIFLSAGDKALYEQVKPQLEVMGKAHYYFGPTGKGTEMKLVVNMIMGSMMTSLCEGITLAVSPLVRDRGMHQ